MLPTETKFCKPALLPHRELRLYSEVDGEQNMGVDNRILNSTVKRTEQVDAYRTGAICIDYDEVAKYDQAHFPGIDTGSCHTQLDREVTLCQSGSFAKIVALKPSQLL